MFLWQLSLVASLRLVSFTELYLSAYSIFEYFVPPLVLPEAVLMGNWIPTSRGHLPRHSDILSCTATETSKLTPTVFVRCDCRLRAESFSLLSSEMVSKPNIICRTLKWNTWFRTQGKLEWWRTLRHLPSRKTVLVMSDKVEFQYIYILFNQKGFLVGYG